MFVPDPSVSFFVHVDDPGEADRTLSARADGGQALMPLGSHPWSDRYGWVQDRSGASWQVVPAGLDAWMASGDAAARDRAFAAMPKMGKLDLAALQAAFEGSTAGQESGGSASKP